MGGGGEGGVEALKAEGIEGTKIEKLEASRNCGVLWYCWRIQEEGGTSQKSWGWLIMSGLYPMGQGFSPSGTTDIWGQIILCRGGSALCRC